jgi:hypothetical protein
MSKEEGGVRYVQLDLRNTFGAYLMKDILEKIL